MVIQMIQDAELRPFDAGDVVGSNNAGKITFTDETSLDIVFRTFWRNPIASEGY